MRISDAVDVAADIERAWSLISDIPTVASCLPGATLDGEPDEQGDHPGRIEVSFGPTVARFRGRARFAFNEAGRSVVITARGQDARGWTRASATVTVTLSSSTESRTRIALEGELEISGPLQRFAETGGVAIARQLMRDFAENLSEVASGAVPQDSDKSGPLAVSNLLRRTVRGRASRATNPPHDGGNDGSE
jgi:uncharacterized protein